jgi:hypothetical protein
MWNDHEHFHEIFLYCMFRLSNAKQGKIMMDWKGKKQSGVAGSTR